MLVKRFYPSCIWGRTRGRFPETKKDQVISYSDGDKVSSDFQTGFYGSEEALLAVRHCPGSSSVVGLLTLAAGTLLSEPRYFHIYCRRIQTCDGSRARPPCSHLSMSFDCLVRGLRFARLVSLFVVWVYVGWWWGVARSSLTWQERCCFWDRVKCSKYAHWAGL